MGDSNGSRPKYPGDPSGLDGISQGAQGFAQGGTGSLMGQTFGPQEGMQRFSQGGMESNPLSDLIRRIFGHLPTMTEGVHQAGGGFGGELRAPFPPSPAGASKPPQLPRPPGLQGPIQDKPLW